jgi:hypothetical protein
MSKKSKTHNIFVILFWVGAIAHVGTFICWMIALAYSLPTFIPSWSLYLVQYGLIPCFIGLAGCLETAINSENRLWFQFEKSSSNDSSLSIASANSELNDKKPKSKP